MTMQAFTSPTRHLVTAAPTFESPSEYADALGVAIRAGRVGANLKLNLAVMELEAQGAGLVYVCNPNNPTATRQSASAMSGLSNVSPAHRQASPAPQRRRRRPSSSTRHTTITSMTRRARRRFRSPSPTRT